MLYTWLIDTWYACAILVLVCLTILLCRVILLGFWKTFKRSEEKQAREQRLQIEIESDGNVRSWEPSATEQVAEAEEAFGQAMAEQTTALPAEPEVPVRVFRSLDRPVSAGPVPARVSESLPEPKLAKKPVQVEAKVAAPVTADEPLECGGCGKRIESKPIGTKAIPGTSAVQAVYKCEHCGARVAV